MDETGQKKTTQRRRGLINYGSLHMLLQNRTAVPALDGGILDGCRAGGGGVCII